MSRLVEEMKQETIEFQRRQKEIQKIFQKYDEEFERWKDGVLVFEHSDFSFSPDSGSDDWLPDGECVWSSESEDDD